jgi:hypothetical protein
MRRGHAHPAPRAAPNNDDEGGLSERYGIIARIVRMTGDPSFWALLDEGDMGLTPQGDA